MQVKSQNSKYLKNSVVREIHNISKTQHQNPQFALKPGEIKK
jgi:hypothetical protein